jgi:hypothetical protein
MFNFALFTLIALVAVVNPTSRPCPNDNLRVTTSSGNLNGFISSSSPNVRQFLGIMNQFSLSWVPYGVSRLAAPVQTLITLGSPSAQSTHLSNLSTLSSLSSSLEQAWSSWARLIITSRVLISRFLANHTWFDLRSLILVLLSLWRAQSASPLAVTLTHSTCKCSGWIGEKEAVLLI